MADPTATVYLVVLIEIHDRQRYDNEYVPAVLKLINKHGGRLVSAVDGAENLEGNLVKGDARCSLNFQAMKLLGNSIMTMSTSHPKFYAIALHTLKHL
jgi:uncharacterized protein (DUF1330 family)